MIGLLAVLPVARAEQAGNSLKTGVSLGATLTRGNSETLQGHAKLETEGTMARVGSVRAGLEGQYGESKVDEERSTTVDNARAYANARKTLSERTFVYGDGSTLYDTVAKISWRATAGPGLGVYFVKNERATLSVEAGLAYVWERVDGARDEFAAYRLAERLEIKLSDTARLWQTAEYLPQTDEFDDFRLTAELGVEAAVNARLNLRLVFKDTYDSRPADDVKKNDMSLIAGIGIKL